MWNKRQFGYLLLLLSIVVVAILVGYDFLVVVMLIAYVSCQPIYQALKKNGRMTWLIPCGLLMAAGLGMLYYIGDLLVFPNSLTTPHHFRDAAVVGISGPVVGFLGTWVKEYRGLPMLNDPSAKK